MKYIQKTVNPKKISVDLKDRKILSLLAMNARMSFTKLAKKVGLSRDAIGYRIKNYEKQGLIQGYRAIVDISKFGYSNYHLFLKLANPTKETEDRIISRLSKIPNIRAVLKFSGNFDFELALIVRDLKELDSLITKIMEISSGFVQDFQILAIVNNYLSESFPKSFTDNFSEKINPFSESKKNTKLERYKLDKKDLEILKIISEEASMNLSAIAYQIELSADAVAYRLKNLVNSGFIIKFVPIINYSAIDYSLHAVLLNINPLSEKNEKKLLDFLKSNKNTLWAVKSLGGYNVLIYFLIRNTEELQETLIELRSLFPQQIRNYESLTAYEEYKYVLFPKELF
jgi:DNA-binding Lrp family transcriptional regulator